VRSLVRLRYRHAGLKGASHAGVAGVLLLMLQHRGIQGASHAGAAARLGLQVLQRSAALGFVV
jgi:hypothetical protein